jgi:hypothetical protein
VCGYPAKGSEGAKGSVDALQTKANIEEGALGFGAQFQHIPLGTGAITSRASVAGGHVGVPSRKNTSTRPATFPTKLPADVSASNIIRPHTCCPPIVNVSP